MNFLKHRRPPPLPAWTALYVPFEAAAWVGTLLVIAIPTLFGTVLVNLSRNRGEERHSVREMCIFLLASVVEQSQTYLTKLRAASTQVFYVAFALSFIVLGNAYKGALTSALSVTRVPTPMSA